MKLTELIESVPNDKELGRKVRKLDRAVKQLDSFDINYDFTVTKKYLTVRFDYFDSPPENVHKWMLSNGFKENYVDDDDCGRLYYFTLEL